MTLFDPEEAYADLTSGRPATVRGQADSIGDAMKKVDDAATRVTEAGDRPTWNSAASTGYRVRTLGVSQGITANYVSLGRGETVLRTAAKAYDSMTGKADLAIADWRNRPAGLNAVVKEVLALSVCANLGVVSAGYNDTLKALASLVSGEKVDPDDLDAETQKWLKEGSDDTEDWLSDHISLLGPLIPNLGLSGDDRGLIPQGLGYDPKTGWIVQTSYRADGTSVLSMVDPKTGREMAEVQLGGYQGEDTRPPWARGTPWSGNISTPDHAGGVATHGKYTYVTSSGNPSHLFTYLTADLQDGRGTAHPVGPPMSLPDGAGAYCTIKDGQLYVGTHNSDGKDDYDDGADDDGRLYRYTLDGGTWQQDHDFGGGSGYVHTPPQVQGVVVRDGEYVFSAGYGRDNQGNLIVQQRQDDQSGNGDREPPYALPNMSEGIIELDGEIVATYESGSDAYGPNDPGSKGKDLWVNPYMTRTPLSELGLSADEVDVSPATLRSAAKEFDLAARPLTAAGTFIENITMNAADFGKVSAASAFTTAVTTLLSTAESSLDDGVSAVHQTADTLSGNAGVYTGTDDASAHNIGRHGPTSS